MHPSCALPRSSSRLVSAIVVLLPLAWAGVIHAREMLSPPPVGFFPPPPPAEESLWEEWVWQEMKISPDGRLEARVESGRARNHGPDGSLHRWRLIVVDRQTRGMSTLVQHSLELEASGKVSEDTYWSTSLDLVSWSPDSSRLLCEQHDSSESCDGSSWSAFEVALDGTRTELGDSLDTAIKESMGTLPEFISPSGAGGEIHILGYLSGGRLLIELHYKSESGDSPSLDRSGWYLFDRAAGTVTTHDGRAMRVAPGSSPIEPEPKTEEAARFSPENIKWEKWQAEESKLSPDGRLESWLETSRGTDQVSNDSWPGRWRLQVRNRRTDDKWTLDQYECSPVTHGSRWACGGNDTLVIVDWSPDSSKLLCRFTSAKNGECGLLDFREVEIDLDGKQGRIDDRVWKALRDSYGPETAFETPFEDSGYTNVVGYLPDGRYVVEMKYWTFRGDSSPKRPDRSGRYVVNLTTGEVTRFDGRPRN